MKGMKSGAWVWCWGVGADCNGELGILAEIDLRKQYPYRIKLLSKKNRGLWYSLGDFDLATDAQRMEAKFRRKNNPRKRTFA